MAILLILLCIQLDRGDFYVVLFIYYRTAPKTYSLHCFGVAKTYRHQDNAEYTFSEPCGKKINKNK